MKRIFILFAVSFVAVLGQLTDDQKTKVEEHTRLCIQETGVDPTLVAKMKKGEFTDNDNLECFADCVLKRIGILNTDGSVNQEVIHMKTPPGFPRGKIDQLVANCKDSAGENCKRGSNIFKCIMQNKIISIFE